MADPPGVRQGLLLDSGFVIRFGSFLGLVVEKLEKYCFVELVVREEEWEEC